MNPLDVFGSESIAADLLEQVRWRDSIAQDRHNLGSQQESVTVYTDGFRAYEPLE